MLSDRKTLDQEVTALFVLKRDKADVKIDKEEYKVVTRLCKVDLVGAAVVLAVCMKSLELNFKGKRSYIFLPKHVTFRTLRRGHDHSMHFVMPIMLLFSSWIMLEHSKDSLVNTWRMKYFLAPHMRFEVNTGRRLELYQDPLAEPITVSPMPG